MCHVHSITVHDKDLMLHHIVCKFSSDCISTSPQHFASEQLMLLFIQFRRVKLQSVASAMNAELKPVAMKASSSMATKQQ